MILCIAFSFNYFLSDAGYEYDPVTAFTEVTRIALPEEIIDEYAIEFTDDNQPENSFSHDPRWLSRFPEEFDNILLPLDFDEGHKTANKMMLYNYYSGEYNTVPKSEEQYNLMAVFYHSDTNMLEIFEYDCFNPDEQNEENAKEENDNDVCPAACYEVMQMAANVAKKLHADGVIKEQFGKDIPIIVHELEYYDLIGEITKEANPDGQAKVFLRALEMDFGYAPFEYET